ncbi:hypothetical protein GCM10023208_01190 [Erythrobacter westpacificensis]|uniref:Putative auto-transporter adhesin head GIN domain-containing protein n=2 Tax=Erythrobacter westpacificensis TaxID=1055231 RepID=A0ABP9JXJ3_9SPHN
MRMGKILGKIAPVVALVAAAGLSGCDNVNVQFGDNEGVPLSELDLSGEAPPALVLASPDSVNVTTGDDFTIDVEGSAEARERMRFALDDDSLAIHRAGGDWAEGDVATINVTMPAPESLVMAGSGSMTVDAMASTAEITMAGSGTITADGIAAERMEVTVAGSGTVSASGTAERLELTVAGSGSADMEGLEAERAEVTVAGSGDATFASNGSVEASIVGSGDVRVLGSASCEVNTVGSGELVCEEPVVEATEEEA